MSEYLVKITIPSVQGLIDRSRKLKDLTGGSSLIPTILKEGLKKIKEDGKVKFIIPTAETLKGDDLSITNVVYLTIEGDKQEVINKVDYLKESILKELDILINKVKEKLSDEDFKEYETLINYQIKNAINVVWAIAEVEGGDLFKAKERVDIALANAKSLIEPDYTYIEGFNLFQKHKNQYKAFKDYQDFLDKAYELNTKELLRGAYLCDVCGKRVIIGATENDFKRSILEDDKIGFVRFAMAKDIFTKTIKNLW
jgi:CRISPR-associated protein.